MDRQNPRKNGKSKAIQSKSHKEAYTYTLRKREKGKKIIYIYKKIQKLEKRERQSVMKEESKAFQLLRGHKVLPSLKLKN